MKPDRIHPGDQFGMLTVLGRDMFDYIRPYDQAHIPMYVCECSCKNHTITSVRQDKLLASNGTRSCGCQSLISGYKHGYNNTRLYGILDCMKKRCYNPSINAEHNHMYKERHIEICPEWMNSENGVKNFCEWALANGYRDDLTIDRIDNNGPYSPDNCRWVPPYVQSNNMSTNVFYTHDGTTFTRACWEYALGIPRDFIRSRDNKGYTFDQIVEDAISKRGINGIYFLNEYGLPYRPQDNNPYENEE